MNPTELEGIVGAFLDSHTTMTVAGCSQGRPWAAAVYFARQDFNLIFFSSTRSRHSTIFQQDPRAAGTVHGEYASWKEIKGIQMEGTIAAVTGIKARASALAAYIRRFPFAADFFAKSGALSSGITQKMAHVALYVFRLESILYMDNSMGFGTRWKLAIEGGKAVGDVELA